MLEKMALRVSEKKLVRDWEHLIIDEAQNLSRDVLEQIRPFVAADADYFMLEILDVEKPEVLAMVQELLSTIDESYND